VTFSPTQPTRVLINPSVDLLPGTGYYVLVDAGAIENLGGEDYAGISSPTAFNFTSAGSPPADSTAPRRQCREPDADLRQYERHRKRAEQRRRRKLGKQHPGRGRWRGHAHRRMGRGDDTFKILAGAGSDVITDFNYGNDVLVLDGFALGTFSAVQAAMSQNGSNTILNLGNGETLTFLDVAKSSFAANDFTFLNVQGPSSSAF
jgi:hypothetical protein